MFRAKFVIVSGSILILLSLGLSYYTFFVPKIGPIGNGKYSWTTYLQLICPFIVGLSAVYKGVHAIRKKKS